MVTSSETAEAKKRILHKREIVFDSAKQGPIEIEEIKTAWHYRQLILQLINRDIVSRYKRSVLGVAWTMLNPLGMMIVMTVVFSQFFNRGENYPLYLFSGLIAWGFFAQTTSIGLRQLIWGSNLMNQVYLPRTVFPISSVGTGLVNLALSLIPLFLLMLVTGAKYSLALLFLPVSMLIFGAFSLGMGMLLASLTMYFPDIADMYDIILRAWLYLTPIIYQAEHLPEQYRWILNYNPMYYLINLFRAPIYDSIIPSPALILFCTTMALIVLVLGWIVYTRAAARVAYEG